MQVKKTGVRPGLPSGYEVVIDGGRLFTGKDAIAWAQQGERLGAGELCINSIDRDGTNVGFEIELTGAISRSVSIPVIASGGAGEPEHLRQAFVEAGADAAIVASMVHYGSYPIPVIKRYLYEHGIEVREGFGPERSGL
jgi:cyclase